MRLKEMRPTSAKVVQALFNILGELNGMSFLDLFSGTGQIAIEAKKRGASRVCLVEADRKRFGDILKNVAPDIKCHCMDVRKAILRLAKKDEPYDIVFADPPYLLGWGQELPKLIEQNDRILSENGVFIFEHSEQEPITGFNEQLWEREDRSYGGTILSFFTRRGK